MATKTRTAAKGGTLRERRREQTRTDTVAGVLAVIDSQGFEKLTIERIAAAAGVSRGTVYAHFPGGLSEMVAAAYAEIGHRIVAETAAAASTAKDWREELLAQARAMFGFAANTRSGYFYNVSGPAFIGSDEARGIGSGAGRKTIAEALERAQSQGELGDQLVPDSVATLLVGAIREASAAIASDAADPTEQLAAFTALVDGLV